MFTFIVCLPSFRQVDQNKMSRAASSVLVRSPESASSAEEPGRRLSMSSLGSPALTTGDSPASGIEVCARNMMVLEEKSSLQSSIFRDVYLEQLGRYKTRDF